MRSFLRSLGALAALMVAALALTGPAAAWDQHAATHLSAAVAVDQHHHHDDDGSVTLLDEEGSGSIHHNPDDDRDGGHDHIPSLLAAMSDVPPEGPAFPVLFSEGDRLVLAPARVPPDLPPAPQMRPPRFA